MRIQLFNIVRQMFCLSLFLNLILFVGLDRIILYWGSYQGNMKKEGAQLWGKGVESILNCLKWKELVMFTIFWLVGGHTQIVGVIPHKFAEHFPS